MAKIKIGIIGVSGRMGLVLSRLVEENENCVLGLSFSKEYEDTISLADVFKKNDVVIDFSNFSLIGKVLEAAVDNPKPLVICTTGWNNEDYHEDLGRLSAKVPIVLATNTSIGAALQRYLVQIAARVLEDDFDIDLHEKHHRFKVDSPSGTASTLLKDIQDIKEETQQQIYMPYQVTHDVREKNQIGVSVTRAGSIIGEHEITFTSLEEQISIKHIAFDRTLFAKGALKAAKWAIDKKDPGIYGMFDVLSLSE